LAYEPNQPLAEKIFASLGLVRHTLFIHDSILTAANEGGSNPQSWFEDEVDQVRVFDDDLSEDAALFWPTPRPRDYFTPPSVKELDFVYALIERNSLNVMSYKTNAEQSIMAITFLEQVDRNLLFRIYVPSGRLWSNEADRLLSLFRDWLIRVKRQRIRQDGYQTSRGEVYEFYAEDAGEIQSLSKEFEEFSDFLDLCVDQPTEASRVLEARDLDRVVVSEIVERYSKEARRLRVDIKHDLETRTLGLRHRLEAELAEVGLSDRELDALVSSVVPPVHGLASAISGTGGASHITVAREIQVNLNPQIIGSVQGIAAQHYQGTAHFGPEASQLLDLIERFAGTRKDELTSALHEFEDDDARGSDRLSAKSRLKTFLAQVGGKIGDLSFAVLQKYLESKIGPGSGS
jgi:hypothetical protein